MSKRDPVVKIQIHVPANVPARASLAALTASNEAGRIVPAYEIHRRAYLAGLRLLEVCAGCRAGTCDGSKHVRLPEHKNLEVGLTSNGFLGAGDSGPRRMRRAETFSTPSVLKNEPNEKPAEMHEDLPTSAVPKSVETSPAEQVGMFFTEPTEDKPAPEPKKKARKKREITEASPERARLIDLYHLEFARVRGETPPYSDRDWPAFDRLLKTHGFDRACELIKNAFLDPWWSKRVTIQKINADPSTFAGTSAPVAVRRSGTTQDELPEVWS